MDSHTHFFVGRYTDDESISNLRSDMRKTYIDLGYSYVAPIGKFTKIEKSLLDGALSDYEVKQGKVYTVLVFAYGSTDFLTALVVIDAVLNDGNFRYSYWDVGRYFKK